MPAWPRVDLRCLALPVVAVALLGCPVGAEQRSLTECDPRDLFGSKCSGASCHSGTGLGPGGVNLVDPNLEERLVDVPATYPGLTDCPTSPEKLIDRESPERSLLLRKVLGTHLCGQAMPIPNPPYSLNTAELELIECYVRSFSDLEEP